MVIGYYKKHIHSLKEKLNDLDPEDNCFDKLIDLQVNIIKRILHTEKIITTKKNEKNELRRDLRTKKNTKSTSKILKNKISRIENRINDYKFYYIYGDASVTG